MPAQTTLTAERLREALRYDPESGEFTWRVTYGRGRNRAVVGKRAGTRHIEGYWQIGIGGQRYLAHRLAWCYVTGQWPKEWIDHRDMNRRNNRWSNLRASSRSQNQANRGCNKNNTSGFKGVSFSRNTKKWWAQISVNGEHISLGYFATREQAHEAYRNAATARCGEFAKAS